MRSRLVFTVRLAVRSPFLFRDPGGSAFGIDAAALRNADGSPVIPADQLRGVFFEAMGDLAAAAPLVLPKADLEDLFGRKSADARGVEESEPEDSTSFAPERGNVLFADLCAVVGQARALQAVRVKIDPETGAAERGFLQIVELVTPPSDVVIFEGAFVVLARAGTEAKIANAFRQAFALIGAIGAQKSVGFGEVVTTASCLVVADPQRMVIPTSAPITPIPVAYRMYFDRAFLVDADRVADNFFRGRMIVPGAVIKGVLARRLAWAGESSDGGRFADLLTKTVISHAFPENEAGSPTGLPLPLSLVAANLGRDTAGKMILRLGDTLGGEPDRGALLGTLPCRYGQDWKDDETNAVRERLGRPFVELGVDVRVHTAIDREHGTAAEGKLFATAARVHRHADPRNGAANGSPRAWCLHLVPPDKADGSDWAALLAVLEQGLDGVGRTGASVKFVRQPAYENPAPVAQQAGRIAIMLTTPAILHDVVPGQSAHDAYAAYWTETIAGAKLVDHVASQRLIGGYLARRYPAFGNNYVPFVLTDPGAVFLLEGGDEKQIAALMRTGLPLPKLNGRQPDWRTCPFVPQNGYGAFTANHFDLVKDLDMVTYV